MGSKSSSWATSPVPCPYSYWFSLIPTPVVSPHVLAFLPHLVFRYLREVLSLMCFLTDLFSTGFFISYVGFQSFSPFLFVFIFGKTILKLIHIFYDSCIWSVCWLLIFSQGSRPLLQSNLDIRNPKSFSCHLTISIFLLWTFHICVSCDWLLDFVLYHESAQHWFLWLNNIPLPAFHILFIHSSTKGHLVCFLLLGIMIIWTILYMFLCGHMF